MCLVVAVIALLRRRATLDPAALIVIVALLLRRTIAIAVIPLVTGIAEGIATHGSERAADGGTLQSAMALGTDDAADPSTGQSTKHRTSLCIRT